MNEIIQTPVNIGPIPGNVVKLPEQGDSLYFLIMLVALFLIFFEVRTIAKILRGK